jgi:hypothetical protein
MLSVLAEAEVTGRPFSRTASSGIPGSRHQGDWVAGSHIRVMGNPTTS